jgi:hypothetical protein
MTEQKQEIDWIEFNMNERPCRMDRINPYDLQQWTETWRGLPLKKPKWRSVTLSKHSRGYLIVFIGHKSYKHHRVVYHAHHPEWDIHDHSSNNQIDHKDNNKTNNNISNLRVLSNAQNMQNRVAKGYWFEKSRHKWRARVTINGKAKNIGSFDTEEEARQAYLKTKRELHPFFYES